jgi:hypothetical protein
LPVNQRENRVIAAEADVFYPVKTLFHARTMMLPATTNSPSLYTETFADAIAAVLTLPCPFMSHDLRFL